MSRRTSRRSSVVAMVCIAALAVGCRGDDDALRVSLSDTQASDGYWAIRSMCTAEDVRVEFSPGERLSAPGLGSASSSEVAVECGDPRRVAVSNSDLRRWTARAAAADLATPTFDPIELTCTSDGPIEVWAHPVWSQYAIVGGALRLVTHGRALVDGEISTQASGFPSELRWWRAQCRPTS